MNPIDYILVRSPYQFEFICDVCLKSLLELPFYRKILPCIHTANIVCEDCFIEKTNSSEIDYIIKHNKQHLVNKLERIYGLSA